MNAMLRSLLVDDEPIALRILESHCSKVDDIKVVATCTDGLDARRWLLQQEIDLVFLDIEMPQLTGIGLIEALERPPRFIFTTAYREHAVKAFELDAIDYLVKPIGLARFLRAVDKFRRLADRASEANDIGRRFMHVRVDRRTVRIQLEDILFIESLSDYVQIHTTDGVFVSKMKISDLEDELGPEGFARVHRSILISLSRVNSFTAQEVIVGGKTLPISRGYRVRAMDALQQLSSQA